MISEATTRLLTLGEVAERLGVSPRTVQGWVYGEKDADPVLDSFVKVKGRRVSEVDLAQFVLNNTVRAKRPKWLTQEAESRSMEKWREIVRAEINAEAQRRAEVLAHGHQQERAA